MIESHDIKALAKNVFSRSRGYSDRQIMHPNREWFFIVAIFFVLFIGGVAVSVWQYHSYQSLPDQVVAEEDTVIPHYNEVLVDDLLQRKSQQASNFAALLGQRLPEPTTGTTSDATIDTDFPTTTDEVETDELDELDDGSVSEPAASDVEVGIIDEDPAPDDSEEPDTSTTDAEEEAEVDPVFD